MTLFRALCRRSFALLWTGQSLSRLGDFVYEIALAWWVLQKTGSAQTMSLVLIFAITPSVLFSLLGGVAVDRVSRVGLMLASDGTRGLVAVTVSVLGYAGRLELWHVLAASLIFGLVDAFFQPAYAVLLPQIVPAEDLPSANSLTSLSLNLGRVASIDALGSFGLLPIGLALAGWATERVGPPTVFVASGLFTALVMVAALAHPAIRGMD